MRGEGEMVGGEGWRDEGEKRLTTSLLRLRNLGGSGGGDWSCWLHYC